MKNIITILKKELTRFFKDKRLILSVLVLPGLMIFVLYSIMGTAMSSMTGVDDDYTYKVYSVREIPSNLSPLISKNENKYLIDLGSSEVFFDLEIISLDEVDEVKQKIVDKKADLLIIFSEDFDTLAKGSENASSVDMYYNSTRSESSSIYNTMYSVISSLESTLITKLVDFNIDANLATKKDESGLMFAMLLPFLIVTFLFSGCMAVTPESIAGEKERGTIATLLVTPIKRSELAIGKIIALSIISVLSAVSSTVGTIISMPMLMKGSVDMHVEYKPMDYAGIFIILIATVLLIVSLMAIISTFAKSVKEANILVMPLMIIIMVVGITSMFGISTGSNLWVNFIPLYSSVNCLSAIFSFEISWMNILLSTCSTIVYTLIFVYILVRMFNSERIMFNK